MLLCLATGLRPKYALKLKWKHLEFENSQVIIKGGYGKINSDEVSDLIDDAMLVLKEWKKHIIHKKSNKN
jgi:integrase